MSMVLNTAELILALSKVKGLGAKTLLKAFPALKETDNEESAYELLCELGKRYKRVVLPDESSFKDLLRYSEELLEKQREQGIVTITPKDFEYPTALLELPDMPIILHVKGNMDALKLQGVAIVGTRDVSPTGQKLGEHAGKLVAEASRSVISGLAEGCDTAAHRGCLQAKGITVAFMATPLDQVRPKSNTELAEQIVAEGGCLVSEYALGAAVSQSNFIARDRLQCGLAGGVLVVETGVKGGTMHAVNGALSLRKPVGCFDYEEDHYASYSQSLGNQMLIREKKALPLSDEESITSFLQLCDTSYAKLASCGRTSLW